MSNSRPFALWIVITCRRSGASRSGTAKSSSTPRSKAAQVGERARFLRRSPGGRGRSRRPRGRSRSRRTPGPPRASQAPSTASAQARRAAAASSAAPEHDAHALQARAAVVRERRQARQVAQCPDQTVAPPCCRGRRARPGRASVRPHQGARSTREPRDAVAEVRERAREREQVLHHGTVAERLDLDGAELSFAARRRGTIERRWLRLRTRIATVPRVRPRRTSARHALGLARLVAATNGWMHGPASLGRMHRLRRARSGTAPLGDVVLRRHHAREARSSPSRRCRPASGSWPRA